MAPPDSDGMQATRLAPLVLAASCWSSAALAAGDAQTVAPTDTPTLAATAVSPLRPDAFFVQIGAGRDTSASVVGANWHWQWQREFAGGRLGGYWEASFGRWNARQAGDDSSAWITQIGLTPVLRYTSDTSANRWFAELGIGANVILPLYRSRDRRFSTAFNFGDHVAVGWRWGAANEHEFALRIQHFSNAGIKHPNPGADFLQLRYTRAL